MNAQLAVERLHSHDTIVAELLKVLSHAPARTTNIESAIAQTSVSARDIATHFGGNRELILSLVSQLSDSMLTAFAPASTPAELRRRLLEFGQRVTDVYSSHLRSLYRIAITESIRHTGLGRDFYEVGPGRLTHHLTDFLQAAQAEGALGAGNPHLLASHFLASLRANLDIADTFLPATNPAAGAHVQQVVDLFLDGLNAGTPPCRN
jgi:hypothetical protein